MLGLIFVLMAIPTPAEEELVETFLESVHYASATKYTTEFPKSIADSVGKIPSELAAQYNPEFQKLYNAYLNKDLVKTIKDIRTEYDRQRREENLTEPFIRFLSARIDGSMPSRNPAASPDTPPDSGELADDCGENGCPPETAVTDGGSGDASLKAGSLPSAPRERKGQAENR